jgi:hypothetical protein
VKKQLPTRKISTTRSQKSVRNSGAWILLDDKLYLTESVETLIDQRVIVLIPSIDSAQ